MEVLFEVWNILATPGGCAVDFETYPTNPSWHGEQAAARAPRGQKVAAKDRAVLDATMGVRAMQRQPCTMQLYHESGAEVFVRLTDPTIELPLMFEGCVADLVAHNAQFETEVLLKHGVRLDIDCTLCAAKALYLTAVQQDDPQPVSFGLADLVAREFGRHRDKTIRDRDWRLEESLDAEAIQYGLQDVRDALDLWRHYQGRLASEGLLEGYREVQQAILPTAASNLTGLLLDKDAHAVLMDRMQRTAEDLEVKLDRICGGMIANHGSSSQISTWVMEEVLQVPIEDDPYRISNFVARLQAKTDGKVKGWRTTKTGHLAITKGSKLRKAEQLAESFPAISEYLIEHARWNKATKLLDAFGPALQRWQDVDGRVRGQFKIWATVTARHSCMNPNLQQMPNESDFRALWIAPPGRKLIIADYSQIELRLLAIITGDERLREVYREGRDVHSETASIAYNVPLEAVTKEIRKPAKAINFGIAYGSGASGLAENGGFSLDEAHMILNRIFEAYPGLAEYREQAPEAAMQHGYIAIRPSRRVLYDQDSPATTAINYPIQGGAASVQMRALRLIDDALHARPDLDVKLAVSVHDEAILESSEEHAEAAAEILVDCMTKALLAIYPEAEEMGLARLTEASIVNSWAEKA